MLGRWSRCSATTSTIAGFWTAVGGSIIVSLTSWLASGLIGNNGRFEVMVIRK